MNNHFWLLQLMPILISLFGNVIFLPFLETMLSIFNCNKNQINIYSKNIKCWAGAHFAHLSFAIIGIVVLVSFSLFHIHVCYDIRKSSLTNIRKKTSRPDIVLLLVKVFLSITNTILKDTFHIVVIFLSFLSTCYLLYLFWFIRPYYSHSLTNLYVISTFILFWGFGLLILGKITLDTDFNGGIPLLFIGIIGILLNIILNGQRVDFKILFFKGENTKSGTNFKDKIIELEELCESIQNRENEILLRGYIQKYEETCMINNCFLKQYLDSSNNIFLYLHIESLYQTALSIYPYCICLRLMYIILLYDKLNKIKKAKGELGKVELCFELSLSDSFAVFYLNKLIEMRLLEGTHNSHRNLDFSIIKYKSLASEFKALIIKGASLYLEFWNLLIISRAEIEDDLTKLNNLGSRINTIVEDIELKMESLESMKKNDEEIIILYSEFLSEIMNKKDKAYEYSQKLDSITKDIDNDNENDSKDQFNEFDILEEEFDSLASKCNTLFIIVSTERESFKITQISLGVSSRLGYLQNELIDHPLDMIIPEIYRKCHRELLKNKLNASQSKITSQKDNSTSQYKLINTFALTKSKYLLSISFNVLLLQTEHGNQYFIAKVCKEWLEPLQLDPLTFQFIEEDTCYVLTNKHLKIKNFTSNTVRLLGLSSQDINDDIEITNYIKEFNEEYLEYNLRNNHKDDDIKDYYYKKRKFVKSYFELPILATWKKLSISFNNGTNKANKLGSVNKDFFFLSDKWKTEKEQQEKCFLVNANEQVISSHLVGFLFKFELFDREISKGHVKAISSQGFNTTNTKGFNMKGLKKISSLNHCCFANEKKKVLFESNQTNNSIENQSSFFDTKPNSWMNCEKFNQSFDILQVNKWFIPSSTNQFILDPYKNAFRHRKSNDERQKMRVFLKEKAMDYVKYKKEEEEITNSDLSSESDYLNSASYEESSNAKNTESYNSKLNNTLNEEPKKEITDDYYHVNLSNIKLMMYDYKKKQTVECDNKAHISEIQMKLSQKEIILDTIVSEYNDNDNSNQKTKLNKNKNKSNFKRKKITSISLPLIGSSAQETSRIKELLIRQSNFSLKKRESQITIILFQIFSLISLIVLLSEAVYLLFLCLNNYNLLKELITLLVRSAEMVLISVRAIYHVRELTLLNNQLYNFFYKSREDYIMNNTLTLFHFFEQYNKMQSYISTSRVSLFDEHYLSLYNKTVDCQIIVNNYQAQNITASIYTSFIFIQLSLFKITQTEFAEIIPTNPDVYFNIYNAMNINFQNLEAQINIFLNKITRIINQEKSNMIIYICIIAIIDIGLFVGMSIFYNKVANKKKGYLEVFLEINNLVLSRAYDKCDKFLNKMQKNFDMNDNCKILTEDNCSSDFLDRDDTSLCAQEESIMRDEQQKYSPLNKKRNLIHETQTINILFSIILGIAFCLLLSNCIYYWTFMDRISLLAKLTILQMHIQAKYLMGFNILREYIVANHTKVYNIPIIEYTEYMISNYVYNLSSLQDEFENEIETFTLKFQDSYNSILDRNICSFSTDFFERYYPDSNCEQMTHKVATYGLQSTLFYYLEEIRLLKSQNERDLELFHQFQFKYNFTLVNTPIGESYWPEGFSKFIYSINAPVNIFNSKDYFTFVFIFRFIINPAFISILNSLYNAIEDEAKIVEKVILVLISFYLVIYLAVYVSVWKPFEMRLNNAIYKTKNMLSIIPIEVLVTIKNIDVLLEIDRSSLITETTK